jgi:hypothetical protein
VFVRLPADSLSGPLDGAGSGLYVVDLVLGTVLSLLACMRSLTCDDGDGHR